MILFTRVIILRSFTEYLNSLVHLCYVFISKLYFRLLYLASNYISNNINYFNCISQNTIQYNQDSTVHYSLTSLEF